MPAGTPTPWLQLAGTVEIASLGIDFTREGNRMLVSVQERASDIWLVELEGPDGPR